MLARITGIGSGVEISIAGQSAAAQFSSSDGGKMKSSPDVRSSQNSPGASISWSRSTT
eukprot:COSAG04_NODE_8930_length_916_cov_1.097919_1_plen_58_part_00